MQNTVQKIFIMRPDPSIANLNLNLDRCSPRTWHSVGIMYHLFCSQLASKLVSEKWAVAATVGGMETRDRDLPSTDNLSHLTYNFLLI